MEIKAVEMREMRRTSQMRVNYLFGLVLSSQNAKQVSIYRIQAIKKLPKAKISK
jgi:hypothetical protein